MVIIGNGLNIGNADGNVQDLAPLISSLAKLIAEGNITTIGNALNLGSVKPMPNEQMKGCRPNEKEPEATPSKQAIRRVHPSNRALCESLNLNQTMERKSQDRWRLP